MEISKYTDGNEAPPAWDEVSSKQTELDGVLLDRTEGRVREILKGLFKDDEAHYHLSYANVVAVRRLGYNDHGPVHARIVVYNALKILRLLKEEGVLPSIQEEHVGTFEDAQVAVALGAFLHDVGMGVTRNDHEWHSCYLADPIIQRHLERVYPDDLGKRVVIRSLVHETIVGHMANSPIHSREAGIVLIADGCDLSQGRARIPQLLNNSPAVGDIHRYSASAIERVDVAAGRHKPVCITAEMENVTGLFQVEEILMTKVKASPIMPHLEVRVIVDGDAPRYYLD